MAVVLAAGFGLSEDHDSVYPGGLRPIRPTKTHTPGFSSRSRFFYDTNFSGSEIRTFLRKKTTPRYWRVVEIVSDVSERRNYLRRRRIRASPPRPRRAVVLGSGTTVRTSETP